MPTVRAGIPHHGEVQTTAGPAAGITVQTGQYTDIAFIQHSKIPATHPSKISNINVPLIRQPNGIRPLEQSRAHGICVVSKAFRLSDTPQIEERRNAYL